MQVKKKRKFKALNMAAVVFAGLIIAVVLVN